MATLSAPAADGASRQLTIAYVATGNLVPDRETARTVLEPWLVEMARGRLGEQKLSPDQQRTVWKATRTPWKVNWPDWWEEPD